MTYFYTFHVYVFRTYHGATVLKTISDQQNATVEEAYEMMEECLQDAREAKEKIAGYSFRPEL